MLRCDPHRRRRVGAPRPSTPLPDALPALLVHVFFFDGFEAPDELRRVKGYAAHDLVNTLGRLRRVNRHDLWLYARARDRAHAALEAARHRPAM